MEGITYSRDACIAAIRDYYHFLASFYLDESFIIEPPADGWPSITMNIFHDLGKTVEVIALLCHLPYIHRATDYNDTQAAPSCLFADWQADGQHLINGQATVDELRVMSEPPVCSEDMPAHFIGLTSGGRSNPSFLLDVKQGVVYWYECGDEEKSEAARKQAHGVDPYDYAPKNEAEWRPDSACWTVEDFFEALKDLFRKLVFIPTGLREVIDVYSQGGSYEDKRSLLQRSYREHGWPDLDHYNKRACLAVVQEVREEQQS
jgi:hypothetical protein